MDLLPDHQGIEAHPEMAGSPATVGAGRSAALGRKSWGKRWLPTWLWVAVLIYAALYSALSIASGASSSRWRALPRCGWITSSR